MEHPKKSIADGPSHPASEIPKVAEPSDVRRRHGAKVDSAGDGSPSETSGDAVRRWSPLSLVVLLTISGVLAGAMLWHLGMVFLTLAPGNSVSSHYRKQINGYIYPELGQNWRLFAPNPLLWNEAIGARVQTTGKDGTRHTWEWVNLTTPHIEAVKHNPLPSHLDQDLLRGSWIFYTANHDRHNRPIGMRGELSTKYVQRIALQSFGRKWNGEKIVAVQLASRTTAVAPPPWTAQRPSDNTDYQVVPWWPVADRDYREL